MKTYSSRKNAPISWAVITLAIFALIFIIATSCSENDAVTPDKPKLSQPGGNGGTITPMVACPGYTWQRIWPTFGPGAGLMEGRHATYGFQVTPTPPVGYQFSQADFTIRIDQPFTSATKVIVFSNAYSGGKSLDPTHPVTMTMRSGGECSSVPPSIVFWAEYDTGYRGDVQVNLTFVSVNKVYSGDMPHSISGALTGTFAFIEGPDK